MFRQYFAALESTALPLVAMAFFAVAFALVLLRTFAWKQKKDYDPIAALPLDDGRADPHPEVTP